MIDRWASFAMPAPAWRWPEPPLVEYIRPESQLPIDNYACININIVRRVHDPVYSG